MFLRYLKNSVWNFLLCCVMSWSLAQMCFLGFYIRPEQQYNAGMLIAIVVIVTAVLWFVSFGKKTIIGGIIGFAVAVVAAFLYLRMKGDVMRAFTDSKDSPNPYLYFMICFAVVIGVWLLASTKRGTFALLVLGIFVEAVIHFLYHNNQLPWLLLFLVCCMINLAVQNYWLNVVNSQGGKPGFASTAAVACVCTVAIALVGGFLFLGIVRPIQPPTKKLYLLEKDMTNTIVDRIGLAKPLKLLDPSLVTDKTDENLEEQSDPDTHDDEKDNGEETEDSAPQDNAVTKLANDAKDAVVDAISYKLPKEKWWLPILIAAIIVAGVILLKILSRRWWLAAVQKRPRKEQISKMYHLFLWKFRVIKEGKHKEETPYEYVARSADKLASFTIPEAGFAELTDIFVRAGYGEGDVSEEDYGRYVAFYWKISGKLRQYLGIRYIIKFFIL